MKRIGIVFFCCFLLCSCSKRSQNNNLLTVEYLPSSTWEQNSGGALQAYQTCGDGFFQLCSMGDALVSITENEGKFIFSKLTGEELAPECLYIVSLPPDFPPEHVQADATGLRYYAPSLRQFVILDTQFQEINRIFLPEDLPENVLLSDDLKTIYYPSDNTICALDYGSGLRRIIREKEKSSPELLGLYQDGRLLLYCSTDSLGKKYTSLITTDNGQTQYTQQGDWTCLQSNNIWIFTDYQKPEGRILFGNDLTSLQALSPIPRSSFHALDTVNQIVYTIRTENQTILDAYSLEKGTRVASVSLDSKALRSAVARDSCIYFSIIDKASGKNILLKWNPQLSKAQESKIYTGPNYTENHPDFEGLQQCSIHAAEMGNAYGIHILLGEEAIQVQPWDYSLQPEYRVPLIQHQLDELDTLLAYFPDGFLAGLSEKLGKITISLVQAIEGKNTSSSLENAMGLQFWQGGNGYIAITSSADISHDLTHELSHMIDTVVINNCNAFDNWDQLNPEDFSYYNNYSGVMRAEDQIYLQGDTRAFIDAYSMTYAAEDRARILEYAINDGNEAMFDAPVLQEKLRHLCIGIRKAMDLSKSPVNYKWEQYLWHSISYKSI